MNVVRIWGGLGNQMFQYAFGRALARSTGEETRYDLSWFSRKPDRVYGLAAFRCEVPEFDGRKARRISRENWLTRLVGLKPKLKRVDEEPANVYDGRLLQLRDSFLNGYFQVARYYEPIRDELLEAYALRDVPPHVRSQGNEMAARESVSLHVRRGDYPKLQSIFRLCDVAYYERAARHVAERLRNPRYYVFSDDIAWCQENLKLPTAEFVETAEPNRPELDMYLMSCCRHNIIANSSFSWWGAWLNRHPERIVVAPKVWYAERPTDVVPEGWERT